MIKKKWYSTQRWRHKDCVSDMRKKRFKIARINCVPFCIKRKKEKLNLCYFVVKYKKKCTSFSFYLSHLWNILWCFFVNSFGNICSLPMHLARVVAWCQSWKRKQNITCTNFLLFLFSMWPLFCCFPLIVWTDPGHTERFGSKSHGGTLRKISNLQLSKHTYTHSPSQLVVHMST